MFTRFPSQILCNSAKNPAEAGVSPASASPSPAALFLRASSARADGPARAAHWVKNSRRTALIFSPPSPENLHKKFLQIPAIRGIVICVIRNGWRWKKRIWGISTVGSALHSHCRGHRFESGMLHHLTSNPNRHTSSSMACSAASSLGMM